MDFKIDTFIDLSGNFTSGVVEIRTWKSPFWCKLNLFLSKIKWIHRLAWNSFLMPRSYVTEVSGWNHNVRTNTGVDWLASQIGNSTSGLAKYVGLSTDNTAPSASDSALAGEIVTNGLQRVAATYAHTASASSFTLTNAFTYTGSSPITVYKAAIFSAVSSGTMIYEALLAQAVTLNASGDIINVVGTNNL